MQNAPSSILIVDHEQGARSDLADCLMERGYSVATTSPGDEARSLLGRQHFDILLAEVGPDDLVYDLGCGDGRTIVTAARRYGARAVGIYGDEGVERVLPRRALQRIFDDLRRAGFAGRRLAG